jgi:hypothetical protein
MMPLRLFAILDKLLLHTILQNGEKHTTASVCLWPQVLR